MSHFIVNESGQEWNGSAFVPRGQGMALASMGQLESEMARIVEMGVRGKLSVLRTGEVRTENPLMEVDL